MVSKILRSSAQAVCVVAKQTGKASEAVALKRVVAVAPKKAVPIEKVAQKQFSSPPEVPFSHRIESFEEYRNLPEIQKLWSGDVEKIKKAYENYVESRKSLYAQAGRDFVSLF